MELQEQVVKSTMQDDFMKEMVEALKTDGPLPIKSALSDWKIEDQLLYFQGRCYVPPNKELQQNIVKKFHYSIAAGNLGQYKTMQLIQEHHWWPGMYNFIKKNC